MSSKFAVKIYGILFEFLINTEKVMTKQLGEETVDKVAIHYIMCAAVEFFMIPSKDRTQVIKDMSCKQKNT